MRLAEYNKTNHSNYRDNSLTINESVSGKISPMISHQNSSIMVNDGSRFNFDNPNTNSPYGSLIVNKSLQSNDFNLKTSSQYETGNFDIFDRENNFKGMNDSIYLTSSNSKVYASKDAMDDEELSSVGSDDNGSVQFNYQNNINEMS